MKKLWLQKYEQKSTKERGRKIPQSRYSQKVFPSEGHSCCDKPGSPLIKMTSASNYCTIALII